MRGGAGLFFDRTGPAAIADLLHFNGVRLQRLILSNPSYPATSAEIAATPTGIVSLDPRQHIPYTLQYSLGVERLLTRKSSLTATYIGTRGIDQFRSIDVNAPLPPAFLQRPNLALGQNRQIQSTGYLKSNSLEIAFRGKPVSFFTGQAQYTLGETYNNTSGITYFPAASYDPAADWSRSDNDRRHKFDLLGTFSIHNWLNFGTALSVYSGKPVNVTTGNDENHDGLPLDRPAGVPRNSFHGPGYLNLDLNLSHTTLLKRKEKESPALTLTLNSFNVLNHVNPVTYVGVASSPFFGHPVASQPSRRMQLNVAFRF